MRSCRCRGGRRRRCSCELVAACRLQVTGIINCSLPALRCSNLVLQCACIVHVPRAKRKGSRDAPHPVLAAQLRPRPPSPSPPPHDGTHCRVRGAQLPATAVIAYPASPLTPLHPPSRRARGMPLHACPSLCMLLLQPYVRLGACSHRVSLNALCRCSSSCRRRYRGDSRAHLYHSLGD